MRRTSCDPEQDAVAGLTLFARRVRCRWRPAAVCGERGSVALLFAVIALGALMMAGLVVDGGAALAARERAADLATQAARAGADALYPGSLYGRPTGLVPDPQAAQTAADRVLSLGGATGTVQVAGDRVIVHATIRKNTVVLSAVGLNQVTGSSTASATPIYGGTTQDGGGS